MKNINKNIILFFAVVLFILVGLVSGALVDQLLFSVKSLCREVISGEPKAFQNFTARVDETAGMLRYQDLLLNLNSAKENLLGTRIVFKDDTTVVKADSGSLLGWSSNEPASEETIKESVGAIERVQEIAERNGADFLYCSVTKKSFYEVVPRNYPVYDRENYDNTLRAVTAAGIPLLDSETFFEELGMKEEDIFFKTDHHWTPLAGFYLHGAICQKLQSLYGFQYNPEYADLKNFNIKTYENWSLGSYGKKVGALFTDAGVDDFDLITPLFETSFEEEIPAYGMIRTGSFADTMLYQEYLVKGYYSCNNYVTYSGGDYRLQKITNLGKEVGDTIVIIRRSFGCVVTPFLAIHAKELHVIDDREGDYPSGPRIDLDAYIQDVQPDYVIVLD